MTAVEVTVAALIAGAAMAALTEFGYRRGVIKANLLLIDGDFALKTAGIRAGKPLVYVVGVVVHLFTSAAFGVAYYVLSRLLKFDPENSAALAAYVFVLWLSMLFLALPIAGQGLLGRRAAPSAWYEQLALHAVFGVALWLGLAFY